MATEEDVKQRQIVETRARNISHNVRCTECGSQSIEDSQADVAILLRKLIRDEIKVGKSDKEIYKKLEDEFGETVLYAPKFDLQTAAIWLSPVIVGGVAAGTWAYQKHRQRTNVHIMALNLVRGVPLTPREKETMLDILAPPPPTKREMLCQREGNGNGGDTRRACQRRPKKMERSYEDRGLGKPKWMWMFAWVFLFVVYTSAGLSDFSSAPTNFQPSYSTIITDR